MITTLIIGSYGRLTTRSQREAIDAALPIRLDDMTLRRIDWASDADVYYLPQNVEVDLPGDHLPPPVETAERARRISGAIPTTLIALIGETA